MLRGEIIGLRAQKDSDVEIFIAELMNDVETRMRMRQCAWVNGGFADGVILSRLATEGPPAGPYSGR